MRSYFYLFFVSLIHLNYENHRKCHNSEAKQNIFTEIPQILYTQICIIFHVFGFLYIIGGFQREVSMACPRVFARLFHGHNEVNVSRVKGHGA